MERYAVVSHLADGGNATLLNAVHRSTGKPVVLKRLRAEGSLADAKRLPEIAAMRLLADESAVLSLSDAFVSDSGLVVLATESMSSSMAALLHERAGRPMPADEVEAWGVQLLRGVTAMHAQHVYHRDLAPRHLLLKGSALKIGDLSSAKGTHFAGDLTVDVGTLWYRAPEQLWCGRGQYGPAVDVWAAGCVLYEMAAGTPLFPGDSELEVMTLILRMFGPPPPSSGAQIPAELLGGGTPTGLPQMPAHPRLRQALGGMLQLDPAQRVSAANALRLMMGRSPSVASRAPSRAPSRPAAPEQELQTATPPRRPQPRPQAPTEEVEEEDKVRRMLAATGVSSDTTPLHDTPGTPAVLSEGAAVASASEEAVEKEEEEEEEEEDSRGGGFLARLRLGRRTKSPSKK